MPRRAVEVHCYRWRWATTPAKLKCFGDPSETLKSIVIRETKSYKLDCTRARPEARHPPFIAKKPHPVGPVRPLFFFARGARVSLAGVLLYISFFGVPLEMDSPRHEHVDLGLHSYPCARLRNWSRQTSWRYSHGTAMLFRQYLLGTVLILSPRESTAWALKCTRDRPCCQTGPSRVPARAQSQAVFPRAGYESKVTSVIE